MRYYFLGMIKSPEALLKIFNREFYKEGIFKMKCKTKYILFLIVKIISNTTKICNKIN